VCVCVCVCHSVRSTRQVKSNPSICLFFYDLLNVFFLFDDLLNVLDLMCVCVCVCVCVRVYLAIHLKRYSFIFLATTFSKIKLNDNTKMNHCTLLATKGPSSGVLHLFSHYNRRKSHQWSVPCDSGAMYMHVWIYGYMYVFVCVCVSVCVYIHTYIHTYIQI